MNCREAKQHWDDYRDGVLSGRDAEMLEEHLADCEPCERIWRRESAFLGILGEKAPATDAPDPQGFTRRVMRAWRVEQGPGVLARIGRLSAAAAVIALTLSLAMVAIRRGDVARTGPVAAVSSPPGTGAGAAANPAAVPALAATPADPVTILFAESGRTFEASGALFARGAALLEENPSLLGALLDSTLSLYDGSATPASDERPEAF